MCVCVCATVDDACDDGDEAQGAGAGGGEAADEGRMEEEKVQRGNAINA